jgi:N-methylhydantoinase B
MVERTESPPRGFRGGAPGRPARLVLDGKPADAKETLILGPGQELVLETPGGGGFGSPDDRASDAVEADTLAGLVETTA